MWKKIFGGLMAIVFAVVIIGLLLPNKIHVERSTLIHAAPAAVFAFINDFRKFNLWSPWAKLDPDTQYTFSGPDSGVDSKMEWRSEHHNVGSGRQQIIVSKPGQRVQTALNFGDMGDAFATFDLAETGADTRITWSFDQDTGYNLISRYFGLMMEKFIGADYEQGLVNLKALVESTPAPAFVPPTVISSPQSPVAAVQPMNAPMLDLARKSGCLACHNIDKKVVGPAWKDVAARYKNDPQAKLQLINKVKTGGKGNWTSVTGGAAMPPYSPRVTDADITALVEFVLAL